MQRKKNTITGTITGIVLQIVNLLIPFFIRSIFIKTIGIEYAGLNSLFTSILQVLNLAELGVGSALVFSMYEPITQNNTTKICALMKLYKLYYRVIGIVVLVGGLVITPALPYLITGSVPEDINLYIIYFLNLGATVASYWLFAYKNAILQAYQRTDVINLATIFVNLVKYALQILFIFWLKNYYVYLIINLVFQLVLNCVIALVSTKMYPQFKCAGDLPKEEVKAINRDVRDLFTAKLGGVILTSADSIVISAFLGLTSLAIYNNYFYIMNAIFAFFTVFYNACRSGIANELIVDSEEKKMKDFNLLSFIVLFAVGICTVCFLNLFQPFMILWMGEEYLLPQQTVVWLCVYFISYELPVFWSTYKDAAGVWRQDRFRPLIGALVNLTTNLILVHFIGIDGILISTIVSEVFICIPWLLVILHKQVIHFDWKRFSMMLVLALVATTLSCFAAYYLCQCLPFEGILQIILSLLISVGIPVVIFTLFFFWTREFKDLLGLAKKFLVRSKK